MSAPTVGQAPPLGSTVRVLLRHTMEAYSDSPQALGWLRHHLERFDEPLRVAIAGKVKAGKSTLLNALVGEEIAPTDAGECTRVVTWYQVTTRVHSPASVGAISSPTSALSSVDFPALTLPAMATRSGSSKRSRW